MNATRRQGKQDFFFWEVKCKSKLIVELLHVFLVCKFEHY